MGDILKYSGATQYAPGTAFSSPIISPIDYDEQVRDVVNETASRLTNTESSIGYELNRLGEPDKYEKIGIKPSVELLRAQREGNLEKILADSQSNLQKTRNALGQTIVNEILLGVPKGITDLFDVIVNAANTVKGDDDTYENPISRTLREAQEAYEQYAPIYSDPSRNTMADGGLGNWGWWMSNIPSVMSSLTLMIPGEGLVAGLSKVGNLAKIGKLGKTLKTASNLSRKALGIRNAERLEAVGRYGLSATTSRVLENHQEAMQVHQDMYKDAYDTLSNMSDDEYANWLDRHQDEFDENFDTSNKDAVAKHIAKKAATQTFMDDMWNTVFDVIQLYSLKNIARLTNAPNRAKIREAHKGSIKYLGKYNEERADILKNRKFGEKAIDFLGNKLYGSSMAIGAELSEGVEEAVNYIAQEEGMHVGNVILEKEKNNILFKDRLENYMLAPQLWDSAVWGVIGGVVFQGLGSAFQKGKNALLSKTDDKYKENKETGEKVEKPSWISKWELPEIQMGLDYIDGRTATFNEYISQTNQINNENINPFETNPDGSLVTFEEDDVIGKKIAINKAIDKAADKIILDSIDAGRLNLGKAFLTDDNVINAMVEAANVSPEDAAELKDKIIERTNKIEDLYNKNLIAIDSALRGRNEITGADYADIPLDYIKLLARTNIVHQLNVDAFEDEAEIVEKEIQALEKDFPEATKYRKNIEHLVNILDYLTKVKELEKLEGDKELNSITKENMISSLKREIRNLEEYISRKVGPNDTTISRLSRFISSYGMGRSMKLDTYPMGHPRREELSKEFEEFDNAILSGDIKTLRKYNSIFNEFSDSEEDLDKLVSASDMAKILNQEIEENIDPKTVYKELANISQDLATRYWHAAALRNAATMEASKIDLTRDGIIKKIDEIHNQANDIRRLMIDSAKETLLSLAKQYGYNTIINYVNSTFKENRGEGFYVNKENITNISDKHKRLLDDVLKALNLSEIQNLDVAEKINNILLKAEASEYATIKTLDEIEEEKIEENKEESSVGLENPLQATKINEPIITSPKEVESDSEAKMSQILDFSTDKEGKELSKPAARIKLNDDGTITLSQIDLNNPNDADYNIIADDEGNIELDMTDVPFTNDIYTNDKLFNLNNNSILDDNINVTKNPILAETNDGNYKVLEKGQINKTTEDNSKKGKEEDNLSFTGEPTNPIIPLSPDNNDESSNNVQDRADINLDYNTETLSSRIISNFVNYLKENKSYDEEGIKKYLLNNINDVNQEDILNAFDELKDWVIEAAKDAGLPIITNATKEIILNNDILDNATEDTAKEAAKNAMNKAMQTILDEYIKYGALDEVKGVYYINLSNLLSYLNKATANKYTANAIYDGLIKIINDNKHKYKIVDYKDDKSERLQKANSSKKEYEEVISNNTIQKLNVTALLDYLKENLSEEEYEIERKKIYEALDKAQQGDQLNYEISNNRLDVYYDGTRLGSYPAPTITKDGKYYITINRGWKVDVPRSGQYTDSKFYNFLYTLFVNPENNENINNVIDKLLRYIHRNKAITNKTKYDEALEELLSDILNINPDYKYLVTDLNNTGDKQYTTEDIIDHLAKLFNYVKQVCARQSIENIEEFREEHYSSLKSAREYSIQQWMNKLKEQSDVIRNIIENESSVLKIATINDGGVIKTTEHHSVKEAIGDTHKGKVFIATTVLGDNNHMTVAGKETIPVIGKYTGRTELVIYSKQPWFVNAYPASFDSSNFNGTEAQVIINEVVGDLEKLLDDWAKKKTPKSFDDVLNYISTLFIRRNGNQPLLTGANINTSKDGSITIHFSKYGKNDAYVNIKPVFNLNGVQKRADKVSFKLGRNVEWTKSLSYFVHPELKEQLFKLFKEYVSFNINPVYCEADNNLNYVHNGFATRNEEGKFVIKIGNHEEHIFDSYNDFIVGQNTIDVNTMHDEYGRNLLMPTIKFETIQEGSPVKESEQVLSTESIIGKGDVAKELIKENSKNAGRKILDIALTSTQLNELKKSRLIRAITPKNIIFVEKWEDGKEHIAALDENDNVIVSNAFINLLNASGEDAAVKHLEAARNIIHEGIHKQLRKEEYKHLIPEIKEIFDSYVKVANTLPPTDSRRRYMYENDTLEDGTRKYHNTDGSINLLGLEEFLVETITRPELMQLLNEYDTNGTKLEDATSHSFGTTIGNLFEKLLKTLAKIFNININEGSILENELKIFGDITKNTENITITKDIENIEESENKNVETLEINKKDGDDFTEEDVFNPFINFSDILDDSISTPSSITSEMTIEEMNKFNKMIENGLITYKCKTL